MIDLSVVIPVYNGARTIAKTLQSVLQDTTLSYEVIVVDDGSSDGTTEIVDEIARTHSEIHLARQANQGVSTARNNGVSMALGEYVWFVDADDIVASNSLEIFAKMLNSFPLPDIVTFGWHRISSLQGFQSPVSPDSLVRYDMQNITDWVAAIERCGGVLWAYNALYRRELLQSVRFRGFCNGEDVLFGYECLLSAKRVWCLNGDLYGYYDNETGASKKRDMRHLESILSVASELARCFLTNQNIGLFQHRVERHIRGVIVSEGLSLAIELGHDALAKWRETMRRIFQHQVCLPLSRRFFYRISLIGDMDVVTKLFYWWPFRAKVVLLRCNTIRRLNTIKNKHRVKN